MCKNASSPCPGCTRHAGDTDPATLFMTADEARAYRAIREAEPRQAEARP
jgi:hypothetical protein